MLRLVGFFFLVIVLLQILQEIPIIGRIFEIWLVGFWLTAILLSVGLSKLASVAVDRHKLAALKRQLGAVETPYNLGKLGTLLLKQKRYKQAIPKLEAAGEGEPETTEWHYRLGSARLGAGELDAAIEALTRAAEIDEEHAYGMVLMRLAEALNRNGEPERAHDVLQRFERNHGPNPESAYRRGLALRAMQKTNEAREAFEEVGELASKLAKYQKKGSGWWVLRAQLARFS